MGSDNLQVKYVGENSFVLDEDKEDDQYMRNAAYGEDNLATVYLKRTFTVGKWNTIVLPIELTVAQVKQAFGEGTKIAEFVGRGGVTGKPSIDFRTVSLDKDGVAMEKDRPYLIKPVKDATSTADFTFNGTTYNKLYVIGRRTLDGNKYVPTPNAVTGTSAEYPDGQVKFVGTYVKLGVDKGPQKGSYLFSGGDMYHLTSPMGIKGFRGWFRDNTGAESIKFNISDGEITSIDEVTRNGAAASGAVYTVDGVKVRANAASLEGLPEGIYIFNGRKHIVK